MIEIKDVVKEYETGTETLRVLNNVSFTIPEGQFVAITGPSGSGKSTLMHILGVLDTPTSGTYVLDHVDVSSLTQDDAALVRRSKIGFVFQSFHLLPRATVLRNVMLPLVYAEVAPAERLIRARQALQASGFDESRELHLSNQLSGGQIQRVAIARALVNNPAMILADEPTGNLDSATGELVLQTFEKLHSEGRTIVLITHEPDVAERAERIIVLKDGVIIEDREGKKRKHNHRT
ncbi:MAG: ABC transporter ATP-binding protein [Patescibacteria group bacterium]